MLRLGLSTLAGQASSILVVENFHTSGGKVFLTQSGNNFRVRSLRKDFYTSNNNPFVAQDGQFKVKIRQEE